MKIALALLGYVLMMRVADAQDELLACYWFLVMTYWILNYMEGKK